VSGEQRERAAQLPPLVLLICYVSMQSRQTSPFRNSSTHFRRASLSNTVKAILKEYGEAQTEKHLARSCELKVSDVRESKSRATQSCQLMKRLPESLLSPESFGDT
jgi:DNA-directed RNA polymerase sigma subunit (sigma70/sigma32)